MKCFTAVALAGLMVSHTEALMLKKVTNALGGYALIKALEPKPPQAVGIMMPMPMMMDTPSAMMEAAKPMTMMEPAKATIMMGGNPAMMMMDNPMMKAMMMDNSMMKAMMKEPVMQQAMKPPSMDAMKMMMTSSSMKTPGEPSDRQVLAALHAIEHNHAHHQAPANLHIH